MPNLIKIVVTVPEVNASELRKVIGGANGGKIGNYTHCSFSVSGIGRFKPEQGSHPAIGTIGKLEEVAEERIEFTCEETRAKEIIRTIRKVHPYEEPVIDIYPMLLVD